MIGRAPVLPVFRFAPSAPVETYPAPSYVSQPGPRPISANPGRTQPASAGIAQTPQPVRPVIRAQAADEPAPAVRAVPAAGRPAPFIMPLPEQLGVAQAKPSPTHDIAWTAAHQRLNGLGATCFHLEKLAEGGCRVTCLLPTPQPDRIHRVEAQAATEAEAVRLMLDKVEEWARRAGIRD